MQVLILRFGAIEILISTDFRDLRIRYQNFDKSLAISVCRVVIIFFIRVNEVCCQQLADFYFLFFILLNNS